MGTPSWHGAQHTPGIISQCCTRADIQKCLNPPLQCLNLGLDGVGQCRRAFRDPTAGPPTSDAAYMIAHHRTSVRGRRGEIQSFNPTIGVF